MKMNDTELAQDAYQLGWLEAQFGKSRETTFLGDDLRNAWFRGYDDFHAAQTRTREEAA